MFFNSCIPKCLPFRSYVGQYLVFWPQLFERWIPLSTGQITIQRIAQLVFVILIRWIAIYPVDSAIRLLNNPDLAIFFITFAL